MKAAICSCMSAISFITFALAAPVSVVHNADLDSDSSIVTSAGTQRIRVTRIGGLTWPWAVAPLPNGDALVSERARSSLRLIHDGKLDPLPVTGLPETLTTDQRDRGGLDIAVHPDFARNHRIYFTYYKTMAGNPGVAAPVLAFGIYDGGHHIKKVRTIFESDVWSTGGVATRFVFGRDRKIYMVIGSPLNTQYAKGNEKPSDFGRTLDAQDPSSLAGKVLRLNDDGSVPADNPFVGKAGYRREIYALGIRNALGMFSDPATGKLWLTDNGPRGGDEINIIEPGRNYGWPLVTYGRTYIADPQGRRTGTNVPPNVQPKSEAPGMEPPFLFWVPSPAVAGMVIYSGDKFPAWRGNILVAELKAKRLEHIMLTKAGWDSDREPMLSDLKYRMRDIKVTPDGRLLVTTDEEDGAVLLIDADNTDAGPAGPRDASVHAVPNAEPDSAAGARIVRGAEAYRRSCAQCHGANLGGSEVGPPLAGDFFRSEWKDETEAALYDKIAKTMPISAPGSLSSAEYENIFEFLLCENGADLDASGNADRTKVLGSILLSKRSAKSCPTNISPD